MNIHVPFDFFSMQSDINKERSRKSFDIKCNNSQGMQKMTKKPGRAKFLKNYHWLLIRFDFWTLWISILKNLLYVALINCDIAFRIYKDIWKQSKSIIIIAVSINVITNDIFIIISISYIINELTELHDLTFIAFFLFLLIAKVHTGKLK